MAGQYIVYKITSINGKQYIGYTSLSLNERLRHHIYIYIYIELPKVKVHSTHFIMT